MRSEHQKVLEAAVLVEGLIRLDFTVTGLDGETAADLERTDFTLLDNGQPAKIAAFHSATSRTPPLEPPTTIIILVDTLDLEADFASFERQQIAAFLRRNDGHLAFPVTLYSLDNRGLALQAKPSRDGNALAATLESESTLNLLLGPPGSNAINIDKDYRQLAPLTGIRALGSIAAGQTTVPGRKLLLWVGPGFRHRGTGSYVDAVFQVAPKDFVTLDVRKSETRRYLLEKAKWLSTCLRQARITLDTFSVGEDEESMVNVPDPHVPSTVAQEIKKLNPTRLVQTHAKDAWKLYLDVVPSLERASIMAVYKKNLAVQSGGRVLPSSEALAAQIESCIHQADLFYTLTFDPPQAATVDEYHNLQIAFSRPGYTAHFPAGYYDEPFFGVSPHSAARPVTAAQFERIVSGLSMQPGAFKDALQTLYSLQPIERLSDRRLAGAMNRFRNNIPDTIRAMIDESTFLPPPSSEILPLAPPDMATSQRMLAAAGDYLSRIIPKLPNFLANRKAALLGQGFSNRDPSVAVFEAAPFQVTQTSAGTVTYRDGKEVVTGGRAENSASADSIYGLFGPFLSNTVRVALDLPGSMSWNRWERQQDHTVAVFRFEVPFERARYYRVSGCCLPGTGESYGIAPGYHGEIAIDPDSGAILRVQVQTELPGFVPTSRSDVSVTYGPTVMGDKTFIVPLHGIAVHRGRTMLQQKLDDWNTSFQIWGAFDTEISEFTFDHYHLFQGQARILPGFTRLPNDGPTAPQPILGPDGRKE